LVGWTVVDAQAGAQILAAAAQPQQVFATLEEQVTKALEVQVQLVAAVGLFHDLFGFVDTTRAFQRAGVAQAGPEVGRQVVAEISITLRRILVAALAHQLLGLHSQTILGALVFEWELVPARHESSLSRHAQGSPAR